MAKAEELFGLHGNEAHLAELEYRHFLYLLHWNRKKKYKTQVVPTKRADALWHAHILFTAKYRHFCASVFGEFVDHNPGLLEGSQPFRHAVNHTYQLHQKHGSNGFIENYLSYVPDPSSENHRSDKSSQGGSGTNPIGAGCGGGGKSSATDSGGASSCGSDGGCGGSCGG